MGLDLSAVPDDVVRRFGLDRLPIDRDQRAAADLLRLDGKRALVTGGGGDGLGASICVRMAEQGADVAVLDISPEAIAATTATIRGRWSVRTERIVADVGDETQVRAAIDGLIERWDGIDILVNNAGGSGSMAGGRRVPHHGPFDEMAYDDLQDVVRVNLLGTLLVTRAALPHMISAGSGRIVNIASEGGKTAVAGLTAYNACKAGVIGLTRSLAAEAGPHGVTVVGVCPGIMVSDRTVRALSDPHARGFAALDDAFARVSLGRATVADEVAEVVAFLASEAGSFIHGTSLSLGGGMAD
jgi:3-oxoacyl-[acyl-carrier protein] reductase